METTEKCSCKKYNKTTDEIVEACSKHRQAALMLKELGEKQKKKIDIFKLEIEQLKFEASDKEKESDELKKRNCELVKQVKLFDGCPKFRNFQNLIF